MAKKNNNKSSTLESTLKTAIQSIEDLDKAIIEAKKASSQLKDLVNKLKQTPQKNKPSASKKAPKAPQKNESKNNNGSHLTHYLEMALEQSIIAIELKKKNKKEKKKKAAYKAKEAAMNAQSEVHMRQIKDKKVLELLKNAVEKTDIAIKETYGNERPYFQGDSIAEFAGEDPYGDNLYL
jgi:uncharacterized coiled-coil protein SlyX